MHHATPKASYKKLQLLRELKDEKDTLLVALETLLDVIVQDKDGNYFICKEAKLEVDDARRVVEMVETR